MRLWPAAAVVLIVVACAQQAPLIRVPVRLVRVPVLAFSSEGKLLNGLQSPDFRLLDNGHPQRLTIDAESNPLSIAIAVQTNFAVRDYLPFVARTAQLIDALLTGEGGESALLACNDDVSVLKPFDSGDLAGAMKKLSTSGRESRLLDAAARAMDLLKQRPASRARLLLLIGQPMDSGSETTLAAIREQAERENVIVFALALPELDKAFVSDTVTLEGLPRERGGFRTGIDLKNLITVLDHAAAAQHSSDPFSVLTAATGGTQIHFRKQNELERALAAIGVQIRSAYVLSYSPEPADAGYHSIIVEAGVAGAKLYARPGYWLR